MNGVYSISEYEFNTLFPVLKKKNEFFWKITPYRGKLVLYNCWKYRSFAIDTIHTHFINAAIYICRSPLKPMLHIRKPFFICSEKKTLCKHIKPWCGTSLKFKFPACKYSFNNPVRMNLFL